MAQIANIAYNVYVDGTEEDDEIINGSEDGYHVFPNRGRYASKSVIRAYEGNDYILNMAPSSDVTISGYTGDDTIDNRGSYASILAEDGMRVRPFADEWTNRMVFYSSYEDAKKMATGQQNAFAFLADLNAYR